MEKVNIKMKSIIPNEEGPMDFFTEGEMEYEDKSIKISYNESNLTGLTNTKTVIEILNNNEVIINRMGDYNSKLHFKDKQKTYTIYNTPHGDITMDIVTNYIVVDDDYSNNKKIKVKLEYIVYINNKINGTTIVEFTIKKDS